MAIDPHTKGLGRRLNHDPRSLRFRFSPRAADVEIKSVEHRRLIPILDQGELGSCTGNATVGCLGTEPFFATVPNLTLDEALAVELYGAATRIDPFDGSYPPEDTGSDGNSIAKAARDAGYISGWTHALGIDDAKVAIQTVPFIVGVNWYNSMFEPDGSGLVTVSGGDADIAGGHEFECVGYNVETDRWKFANSWGLGWADEGYFYMTSDDFGRLLDEQGDVTVFVALSEPAPEPTPEPTPEPFPVDPTPVDPTPVDPEPTPTPVDPEPTPTPEPAQPDFPTDAVQKWIKGKHYTRREAAAANAIATWLEESS